MSTLQHNVADHAPDAGFVPIPKDRYQLAITHAEWKDNKSGNGQNLNLRITVLEGPYQDRSLFDHLALYNDSEQAVKIARGRLSAYCLACQLHGITDDSQLLNIPFYAEVDIKREIYNGESREKNVIRKMFDISGGEVGAQPAQAAQQQGQQQQQGQAFQQPAQQQPAFQQPAQQQQPQQQQPQGGQPFQQPQQGQQPQQQPQQGQAFQQPAQQQQPQQQPAQQQQQPQQQQPQQQQGFQPGANPPWPGSPAS